MFVLCVVSKDKEAKCRTIKTKETNTNEVQTEYKKIHKKIPVEARFSARFQTGPEAHPASCKMGRDSFS